MYIGFLPPSLDGSPILRHPPLTSLSGIVTTPLVSLEHVISCIPPLRYCQVGLGHKARDGVFCFGEHSTQHRARHCMNEWR